MELAVRDPVTEPEVSRPLLYVTWPAYVPLAVTYTCNTAQESPPFVQGPHSHLACHMHLAAKRKAADCAGSLTS
jgi:hypothetical protein